MAGGDLTYGTYIGGNSNDYFNAIEVLPDGRVAFIGTTDATNGNKGGFTAAVNDVGYRTSTCTDRSPFVGVIDLTDGALDHLSLICTDGLTDGIAIADGGTDLYVAGFTEVDAHVVPIGGVFCAATSNNWGGRRWLDCSASDRWWRRYGTRR